MREEIMVVTEANHTDVFEEAKRKYVYASEYKMLKEISHRI